MTHEEWMTTLAPIMSALVLGIAAILGIVLTGIAGRLKSYLDARGMAAAAQAVAAANAVIQPALMTGASTMAGKIARGELDYTNRAALTAEAAREVGLVEARIPGMIAVAAPMAGALVASMMAKVDAQMVASLTPLAGQVAVADVLPARGAL